LISTCMFMACPFGEVINRDQWMPGMMHERCLSRCALGHRCRQPTCTRHWLNAANEIEPAAGSTSSAGRNVVRLV
jgi:hypothetical protein